MAATRRNVAAPAYNEPSDTAIRPNVNSVAPEAVPYKVTETKLPTAAIHTIQVFRSTVNGFTPPIHSSMRSISSAAEAETTSNDRNIGTHSRIAPMKRLTGFSFAMNHDGDVARGSS